MANKPLTAKYFIYDVVVWPLFYSFLALPLRFGKQYSPNLLQKLQSCLPYTLPLWFLQSVCKHLSRRNPGFTFLPINILSGSGSNHCATRCLMQVTVCAELENRIRLSLCTLHRDQLDRKSTRLNSSHVRISYAVFCLKKKKITFNSNLMRNAELTGNTVVLKTFFTIIVPIFIKERASISNLLSHVLHSISFALSVVYF